MEDNQLIYTILVSTLVILFLIAGVIAIISISNRKQVEQEVKMAQLLLNYEKELRSVENEVQEQVLMNISRELHDNIGQLMTVMNLQLEQQKMDQPDLAVVLNPVHQTLGDTMQQLRLLGRSLNSDMLEQNGLLNAIEQELKRLRQLKHVQFHWEHDNADPRLNKDQRIMTFRMFQEMINNALKHSRAKNIYINLSGSNGLKLTIKDDGQGFNMKQTMETAKGMGLRNIIKRAALANLQCSIDATEGKGCIFTLQQA